jgi:hypothetical protein
MHFDGVRVAKDYMTGVISSAELVEKFNQTWIPFYQRERVMRKKKINALKAVFQTGGKIDSIKLNLIGDYIKEGRQAILSGTFRTIDGQQRLWALKESGVKNILIPVELYINIPEQEEVKLFHQFNREASQLLLGDLLKSTSGQFADWGRRVVKDSSYPIKVNINSRATGINLGLYASILHMVHRRLLLKTYMRQAASGNHLITMFEAELPIRDVAMTEYGVKNILKHTVQIFGEYDSKALCYTRRFFLAWCLFVTRYFMTDGGVVSFKKYQTKIETLPNLLNNSRMRELLNSGSPDQRDIIQKLVEHFNYKNKRNILPPFEVDLPMSEELKNFRTRRSIEMTGKLKEAVRV